MFGVVCKKIIKLECMVPSSSWKNVRRVGRFISTVVRPVLMLELKISCWINLR